MPPKMWIRVLVCLIVLLSSCFRSHEKGPREEVDDGDFASDSGSRSPNIAGDDESGPFRGVDATDRPSLDSASDSPGAAVDATDRPLDSGGDSPNAATDDFTIVGAWEGEFILYYPDDSSVSLPVTCEFTDTEAVVFISGVELDRARYYVDNDQAPYQMEIKFDDPWRRDNYFTFPMIYDLVDDDLIIKLSKGWPGQSNISPEYQPKFEVKLYRIP